MKLILLVSIMLVVATLTVVVGLWLLSAGGVSDSEFQINVDGTPDLSFAGGYMVITSDGQSISTSVDGYVLSIYKVTGRMVSVYFQKQTKDGTLKVTILRDGKMISRSDTIAEYGIVSLATR